MPLPQAPAGPSRLVAGNPPDFTCKQVIWALLPARSTGKSETSLPLLFFAIFIAVPIIEIAIFIQVGGLIGLWPTIAIVLGTALAGATLIRIQGFQTWRRAEEAMKRGEPPLAEMFDGVFLLVAALLMVTPGLFTDCIGIALLIPPLRREIGRRVAARLARSANVQFHMAGMGPGAKPQAGPGPVIDGEAEEISPGTGGEPRDDSPWRQ